ncbi:MAG: D-tyrosyl-tRNA(Tyr) deacylase [Clostridia bacterium]|jgi:D-tyrosyl-tRNA(Tyr) deacylase|nr:D-tyrosyl-tRNA(Tyr) deacylase [Clostridia bacterium]
MRAVVQRCSQAKVEIDGKPVGSIAHGLCVLLGIDVEDTEADATYLCEKLIGLRIFDDENGVPNRSVADVGGRILLISQFTLMGDARKGRRPSYIAAARPETAVPLYEHCIALLKQSVPVETGVFGADMQVTLTNDGPFTILLDSRRTF